MRVTLAAVGKLKQGSERDMFEHYWLRIEAAGRPVAINPVRLEEIPESRAASPELRKSDEAQRLLKLSEDADARIVLDERGKSLTSEELAGWIRTRRDDGLRHAAFLIGGPDGHGPAALSAATMRLSLSALTLPHGLARILLAEQIYRAATIIAGHPYHRA
jgi:23S rRNA (pseudouridine1915-N3)-methyltransferase